ADLRLTPLVQAIGMQGLASRMERVEAKQSGVKAIDDLFATINVEPEEINPFFEKIGSSPVSQKVKMSLILSRPHVTLEEVLPYLPKVADGVRPFDAETVGLAETDIKYRGYIEREREMVEKMNRLEDLELHHGIDYHRITSLSAESREKLSRLRPRTLGQASRISGVSPSDISVLLIHFGS